MRATRLMILFMFTLGCGQSPHPQSVSPGTTPAARPALAARVAPKSAPVAAPMGPEPVDPMAAASAAGDWSSESCGARTYERRLHLKADGYFTAEDLVSPCPEGAQCVWSGIETRRGKWKQGSKILLLREEPSVAKMGPAFPLELDWDGRLREGSCEYQRAAN